MISVTLPDFNIGKTSFDDEGIKTLPTKKIGLYFIYNNYLGLMYIGKASDIRSRLMQHYTGSRSARTSNTDGVKHLFDKFKAIFCESKWEMDMYETYAINQLKPKVNRDKTWTYSSSYQELRVDNRLTNYKGIATAVIDFLSGKVVVNRTDVEAYLRSIDIRDFDLKDEGFNYLLSSLGVYNEYEQGHGLDHLFIFDESRASDFISKQAV